MQPIGPVRSFSDEGTGSVLEVVMLFPKFTEEKKPDLRDGIPRIFATEVECNFVGESPQGGASFQDVVSPDLKHCPGQTTHQ